MGAWGIMSAHAVLSAEGHPLAAAIPTWPSQKREMKTATFNHSCVHHACVMSMLLRDVDMTCPWMDAPWLQAAAAVC